MTANQIQKALLNAGIESSSILDIRKNEVEVGIMVEGEKYCDYDLSDELAEKVKTILNWKHGMRTGYNSWILEGTSAGAEARAANHLDQFGTIE